MNEKDTYNSIAEYYDYMLPKNPEREAFFSKIFEINGVKSVLDCACGTGNDLILFNSFGLNVTGSDLSDSMLNVAKTKIQNINPPITLIKADFQKLSEHFNQKFDAVVCLSNAINEIDIDVNMTLKSFKSVLNKNGIMIFDQGHTDFSMKEPVKHSSEVNTRDFSRLFTMDYCDSIMKVQIYDFLHTEDKNDFKYSEFFIKINLYNDWQKILKSENLSGEFYGDWNLNKYSKGYSRRLIIVAK